MKSKFSQYQKINLIFAGILLSIFIYSAIFSHKKSNHPIPSFYTMRTGKTSISTGLSRAFSAIVRLDFDAAFKFNIYSMQLFLFFLAQLFMRLIAFWLSKKEGMKQKAIVIPDVIITIAMFLYCFWPFIIETFKNPPV